LCKKIAAELVGPAARRGGGRRDVLLDVSGLSLHSIGFCDHNACVASSIFKAERTIAGRLGGALRREQSAQAKLTALLVFYFDINKYFVIFQIVCLH